MVAVRTRVQTVRERGCGVKELTFRGGVHPYDGKELTKDKPIEELLPKGKLVFPTSQHIGAPAKPIVKVGDSVLVGQRIAEADGFVSANICSSVSGVVAAIEPRLTASGSKCPSIIIENDDKYKGVEGLGRERDDTSMTKSEIRGYIKDAGIVGMGGAGFPTHVKLSPKNEEEIRHVIINGAECEPYLTSDHRIMTEQPEKVIGGLKVILRLFENAKGVIAIEDNKMNVIKKMQRFVRDEEGIEVKVLKTKYPQGAERQLIYASTGIKMNSSMLPADVGCIVNNVDTAAAVYRMACESTPSIERIITVTGDAISEKKNFSVRIGTSYKELIEAAGGFRKRPAKVISGGPMMGLALFDLDIPVTKTSSALLALGHDEVAEYEPTPCIRCGRCVEVCPSGLVPQKMLYYADAFDDEGFLAMEGMECYECGCCTYVCPAKRRMTQSFKQTRRSILDKRKR